MIDSARSGGRRPASPASGAARRGLQYYVGKEGPGVSESLTFVRNFLAA